MPMCWYSKGSLTALRRAATERQENPQKLSDFLSVGWSIFLFPGWSTFSLTFTLSEDSPPNHGPHHGHDPVPPRLRPRRETSPGQSQGPECLFSRQVGKAHPKSYHPQCLPDLRGCPSSRDPFSRWVPYPKAYELPRDPSENYRRPRSLPSKILFCPLIGCGM